MTMLRKNISGVMFQERCNRTISTTRSSPWPLIEWTQLLFVGVVTLFGLLANGYRYGIWDHAYYIPMIEQVVTPSLFPNDYFFNEELKLILQKSNVSVPLLATLTPLVSLESIFFVTYLLAQFFLFFAIYSVSFILFESRGAAALAVLLLVVPKAIGGTWTFTQDMYFTLRGVAMPMAIVFLVPYFRGRLIPASIIAGIVFLIHPITAVPIICLLLFRCLIDGMRHGWSMSGRAFGLLLVFILPQFARVIFNHPVESSNTFFPTSEWLEIIKQRDPYTFVSNWGKSAFLATAAYLALLSAALLYRKLSRLGKHQEPQPTEEADFWTVVILLVWAGLSAIGFIFVEWYPVALVIQLQLQRSFYLVIYLGLIYTAWLLWDGVRRSRISLRTRKGPISECMLSYAESVLGPVALALIACLLASNSIDRLVMATAILVCWSLWFGFRSRMPVWDHSSNILAALGGLVCVSLMWHFRKVLFEHGLIDSVSLPTYVVALSAFVFLELAYGWTNWREWHIAKTVTASSFLIATSIGLVTSNWSTLKQVMTKEHFAEEIQLPGLPLRSNWTVGKNYPLNDVIDTGKWAQANTRIDEVFVVPPDVPEFRVHSRRGIVGAWDDGGPSYYSRRFAMIWQERMEDLKGYDSFGGERFSQLSEKYMASFAVTRNDQQISFPVVYRNQSFVVYKLRERLNQ